MPLGLLKRGLLLMVDKVLYSRLVVRYTELPINLAWNRGQKPMVPAKPPDTLTKTDAFEFTA